ncbi:DUF7679 family protein [Streptococcus agalactiae]|uniref:DUF7679 family protein n=1 Tax=Streptococcus agalactiae TaxID=1311 RepID=UPI0018679180|nr:hypothetical protein [Streptococcus agalactiae]MBE3600748.1 hypothetical protein [Streptococcus agalactiae]
MGKSYYYVEVETLQGELVTFQLPKDLQEAMRAYRHTNPLTWEDLLAEALINIPSAAYTKNNDYQPTIRLGKVKRSFSLKKQQRRRSRGQFLTKDNWQQTDLKHFRDNIRFIQHDYPFRNKVILWLDYWRWHYRLRKSY